MSLPHLLAACCMCTAAPAGPAPAYAPRAVCHRKFFLSLPLGKLRGAAQVLVWLQLSKLFFSLFTYFKNIISVLQQSPLPCVLQSMGCWREDYILCQGQGTQENIPVVWKGKGSSGWEGRPCRDTVLCLCCLHMLLREDRLCHLRCVPEP